MTAAVIGAGDVGADLTLKLLRSRLLELRWVVGDAPDAVGVPVAPGLGLAREYGLVTSDRGPAWLLAQRELPNLLFDTSSAAVHRMNARRYAELGIQVVDLTPAAVGPAVVPAVNLEQHLGAPNVSLISGGGQVTIPLVHAVSRVTDVASAEIAVTVPPFTSGPASRGYIDEVLATTSRGIEHIGGARQGSAFLEYTATDTSTMRATVSCVIPGGADQDAIAVSIFSVAAYVASYVPGYRMSEGLRFDEPGDDGRARVSMDLEVEGSGDHLAVRAGNLDALTAAAAKVGDCFAERFAMLRDGFSPARALRH